MVTDVGTMREFYVLSMKEAAEMLGCSHRDIHACVFGRNVQNGYYQVRYKNYGDAVHVMSGIYKSYLELMVKKRAEVMDVSDSEFDELSRELAEMEKNMEKEEGNS